MSLLRSDSHVLLILAASTALTASLGGAVTSESVQTWYPMLNKPVWTPPSSAFGPAWTFLYVLMTIAAWRVWKAAGWSGARTALILFFLQLVLNAAWSFIFFGLRQPGWALAEIILLWAAIGALFVAFRKIDRPASALIAPYFVWVTFAACLNFSIWRLNS